MGDHAIRWSGLPLIAGGALLGAAIVGVSLTQAADQGYSPIVNTFFLLSAILLLTALPGMYARQASAVGWLGLAGHVLLQIGVVLFIVLAAPPLVYPSLAGSFPENAPSFFLALALTSGLLLTGLATIRARVFPRWAGLLQLGATASFFFGFFVAELLPPTPRFVGQAGIALLGVLLALPLVGIGLHLWRRVPHV